MSVVVTGVAGFIGSHLATRLLAQAEDVIGLDCLTDYYDVSLKRANLDGLLGHPRFQFERLDLAQDELPAHIGDASCVYHLAAQPGVRKSWGGAFDTYVRNNIVATQRLLEAMRESQRPDGLRLIVLRVRRSRAIPDARGLDAATDLSVWRVEAVL